MQQKNRGWFWLFLIMGLILLGWPYVAVWIWGKPVSRDAAQMLAGGGIMGADWVKKLPGTPVPESESESAEKPDPKPEEPDEPAVPEPQPPRDVTPTTPAELIQLGEADPANGWYLRVILNKRGGAVQQVVLTDFQDADRLGLAVNNDDGTPRKLHLIPGVVLDYPVKLKPRVLAPTLQSGPVPEGIELSLPSFAMYHYAGPKEDRPQEYLGTCDWDFDPEKDQRRLEDGTYEITFRKELKAPHHVKITKTFSLKPGQYHIGHKVQIEPLPERGANAPPFRYQLSGPFGLPIEGEWYTSTYRNALIGYKAESGGKRKFVDSSTVRHQLGSEEFKKGENELQYAAVSVQYFASAVVVDNEQADTGFLERVRATYEETDDSKHKRSHDLTVRAVTEPLELRETTEHAYVLYNGPAKVRLLKQLETENGEPEVDPELVDRYLNDLNLYTLTDYHSPNWFARQFSKIGWTDLIIFMTNQMHSLLGWLHGYVASWGLCVLLLTVIVRLCLHPLSRKQAASAKDMQEKMTKVKPEMQKIKEKYQGDMQAQRVAMMELYRKHGINPFAMMGGCLLLLLQMPIFMGLYWCLNESIFFRLESFLWMPNLGAPDMLFWWTENIPVISDPSYREALLCGMLPLGMLYLGPYFNILPLLAVGLMLVQQKLFMPPPQDEQQEMQQKMMKYMMIMFAVFFYKIAAGVALYFVASTLWGITERKLLPKAKPKPPEEPVAKPGKPSGPTGGKGKGKGKKQPAPKKEEPKGFMGKLKAKWAEVLEEAKKKQ